ncbi:MAG: beta-N-acetylhexosaminidase [Planctomycetaceae bacterium]|nr:beta-N-acetylhexosaminidase [Planctomycetaceae bacterium]
MRKQLLLVLILLTAGPLAAAAAEREAVSVIPQPEKMEVQEGKFLIGPETAIVCDRQTRQEAEYLRDLLRTPTRYALPIRETAPRDAANSIVLRIVPDAKDLGEEGYALKVSGDRVVIEAGTAAGVFYGCQTLRQLLPAAIESDCLVGGVEWEVPCVEIKDRPRYSWRGIMLGPGHNFLTTEFVKHYLDVMALYKLNRLHLHLTDMGWAIEIKKYPELTKIENWPPILPRWRRTYGKCTQGFYTQEDVREIVAHATRRHILVIPEIELPAHSSAALACYPELLCPNWKSPAEKIDSYFQLPFNYCAGNEKTFEFLEGVLSEVIELFPGPYVHIGGDERVRGAWEACPKCQARIKSESLKNEDELQSYFVKRIEKFVQSKGRQIIGWSEIMEGGLAPEAVVQSWLDPKHAVAAVGQGHDVIMSTNQNCYLNYRGLSLEKSYAFEPTPPELSAEAAKHILGVEPCLWGFGQHRHDELVFPRLCAFAEVGWSPKGQRNWDDFKARLKPHGRRLDELGIDYHRDPAFAEKLWE